MSTADRRLSRDSRISMTSMALCLGFGLHATHMLVPPTPGPLAVAVILGADLGRVIAVLACAAGGTMIFHGNDDFFRVITSTSEMKPEIAYKTIPIISIAQSATDLACVFVLEMIFV